MRTTLASISAMKKAAIILPAVFAGVFLAGSAAAPVADQVLQVAGLREPVEIVIDTWGMPHIYAQSQRDLFFAQGFNAARDRLFQLELWRRRATGTMAEIQGGEALKHDVAARLLQFRTNDLRQEMNHYHPQGEEIITSFVAGVNAYIAMTEDDPSLLPLEFNLLGIRPGRWTPEVVLSRHNGLYRNVKMEVQFARLVPLIGVEQLKNLLYLRPHVPDLAVPEGLDYSLITDEVLRRYRPSQKFTKEDLESTGSNNWVVSGERTITGRPVLANDPHRTQQVPSLRYWVHLVAPNWNVIGAGEPALPGVSIGHNQYGAWGLTIFAIDQEDLYVYDTQPGDAAQYRYQEGWERMRLLRETIPVRGASPESVDLKFTRHGPVLFEDTKNHKAYALRAAWLEIGTAPYLASLRIDQAKHWEEFRQACSYFRTPSENLIWADVEGNIGWQAVGLAPIRKNWSGLLPVTGDGRFEWNGYLPILELPHRLHPPEGFIATANQENLPPHYPVPVGFLWADPFRFARIQEFLNLRSQAGMMDMIELQQDVLSVPARTLVPLLKGLRSADPNSQRALELLPDWDFRLLAACAGRAFRS